MGSARFVKANVQSALGRLLKSGVSYGIFDSGPIHNPCFTVLGMFLFFSFLILLIFTGGLQKTDSFLLQYQE